MNVYDSDIDLTKADENNIFLKTMEPCSDDIKYDLTSKNFNSFLNTFKEKID